MLNCITLIQSLMQSSMSQSPFYKLIIMLVTPLLPLPLDDKIQVIRVILKGLVHKNALRIIMENNSQASWGFHWFSTLALSFNTSTIVITWNILLCACPKPILWHRGVSFLAAAHTSLMCLVTQTWLTQSKSTERCLYCIAKANFVFSIILYLIKPYTQSIYAPSQQASLKLWLSCLMTREGWVVPPF